jgi:hypothetical protein
MAVFAASFLVLLCPAWAATGISEEEKTAILDAHNTYRCMHGVPLFEWDDAAAAAAQAHVDTGDWAISDAMVGNEQCSENLAWGSPTMTVERATEKWYEEIENTPDGAGLIPEYTRSCGYYSTLVWKSSIRIGCGRGTRNGEGGDYTTCYYCPAGNVAGEFTENVLAPSKTAEQCADPYASDGDSSDDTDDGPSTTPSPDDNDLAVASSAPSPASSVALFVSPLMGVAAIAV